MSQPQCNQGHFSIYQLYSRWIFQMENHVAGYQGQKRSNTGHLVSSLAWIAYSSKFLKGSFLVQFSDLTL